MTIKKFAFEVQAGLRQAHGIDLKRSHDHKVLAALFIPISVGCRKKGPCIARPLEDVLLS